jgi:hypothetical protein
MKKQIKIYGLAIAALLSFASCQKDNDVPGPDKGTVRLQFSNKVGTQDLRMAGNWYTNENNDSFTVTKFNYYISNIKLNGDAPYTEASSYHLLQQSSVGSMTLSLLSVPSGVYKSLSFMIGVDSARNVSGAQSGALAVSNGMFWDWNSGYIMLKFEGTSPQSTATDNMLMLHAGGFKGENSVLRTITLDFPKPLVIKSDEQQVQLSADVLALFKSPNKLSFATTSVIHMPGADARKFADNYANMFQITGMTP